MASDSGRIIQLAKRREREKEDIELQKQKMKDELQSLNEITTKFTAHYDAIEETLKTNTVGLVTLDEMMQKQKDFITKREIQLAHRRVDASLATLNKEKEAIVQRQQHQQEKYTEDNKRRVLSFDLKDDEDEEEDAEPTVNEEPSSSSANKGEMFLEPSQKKIRKDPSVDTAFLPDRLREAEENKLREELRLQWVEEQERLKSEEINIAFSYWDGSGHRRDTRIRKGATISQFLAKAVGLLRKDYSDLRSATADSLMFVKEDLIIPQFYTFQDFIVAKAMGKTGPLFEFDAAAEIRLRQDAVLDSESHPAKVVLRSWFEKNKHIYPASRWEPFVPNKKYRPTFDDLDGL